MNGFEKHGIEHLSASSINMYSQAPCAWVAKYLFGAKFSFGSAARAGVLVEDAVANVLTDLMSLDEAIDAAQKAYNKEIALSTNSTDLKRGEGIANMISLAVEALEPYGKPTFETLPAINAQKKIELVCRGNNFTIPIVGYIDFYYPEHNLIVDLKTTMRMPSQMPQAHMVQGSIYKKAENKDVKFLYVTPSKYRIFDVEGEDDVLSVVKKEINRMEAMLSLDHDQIKNIVPIVRDSFYWLGDEKLREEFYGY